MAVIKCKMCGGDLNISEDSKIVECEYCGTTQTIPTADNEKKLNLYNRANRLRFGNEFDKAAGVFESIVAEFPEEAEAYWGLCLCKYGIEYVDDPATGNKIPTCHRTSYDSIFDDSNFEIALEYADPVASKVYREEAKKIDQIQKGILEIANNEDPFDIFICYKETDELGERTADSVYAQEIYNALTKEGYRVFFSRITLEDKLGQEYEPYIFSALNSAKVMLAIGTSYDYFNAVWVKNEWARFLELIKEDKSRVLIPCYKDIDAYDIPAEFRNLQGQDMNKLGFLQDLTRGVNKICRQEKKAAVATSKSNETKGVDALVKRGFIFLGDKDFEKADEYFERALDENPENSRAYLGKVLCEFKLSSTEMLKTSVSTEELDDSRNFEKVLGFADDAEKKELKDIYESIKNREEFEKLKKQFENLIERIDRTDEVEAINQLKTDIENFSDKFDIKEALNKCDERIELINNSASYKEKGIKLFEQGNYNEAYLMFREKCVTQNVRKQIMGYMSKISGNYSCVSSSRDHIVFLTPDKTVVAIGDNSYGKCNIENWNNIIAVSASSTNTVGLRADGTVVVAGKAPAFKDWSDIVAISTGRNHIVGLKADGTVVAVGDNIYGECNTEGWKDIVAIYAGDDWTAGLKADGTVVVTGDDLDNQCNTKSWTDIIEVSAGDFINEYHMVGLKTDGTVVAVGYNEDGECNTEDWTDIIAVSAGDTHTVGLRADGTVVAVGDNIFGECNTEDWTDIVAIYASENKTIGLRIDGTFVAVGDTNDINDINGLKAIDIFEHHKILETFKKSLSEKQSLKPNQKEIAEHKEKQRIVMKTKAENDIKMLESEMAQKQQRISSLGLALFGSKAAEKKKLQMEIEDLLHKIHNLKEKFNI